jgi:protein-tyrosine phosphatase
MVLLDFSERGGKRAFARTIYFDAIAKLGGTRAYRRVEWSRIRRVVFVCKGNICRSPFAEAVARQLGLTAVSCGFEARTGAPADAHAVRSAAEHGIDLSSHRATHADMLRLDQHDLLVGFETWHLRHPAWVADEAHAHQSTLLGAWARPPNMYIHDPYGTSPDCFRRCFLLINHCVEDLACRIRDDRG